MFPTMGRAHKLRRLAVIGAALIAAPAVDAATVAPTPSQIRAAIHRATTATTLWATINRCDDHHDGELGIRGEMPSLSFPARLLMVVTVSEWSATAHRYVPLKGSYKLAGAVVPAGHTIQDGINLRFGTPATLIGQIRFEWFRDGRLLGTTTRMTTGGHGASDNGTPTHFSAAACTIT
jgi:hypothetical protein